MTNTSKRTTKANRVEKDSPEQQCKHGVDIYNCYDGCYDDMKNGTVERQTAIDSRDPAAAGRRAAKASGE